MEGQGCKGLRGALGEADVAERGLRGVVQNVGDAVGNVVEGEFVDREVPKFR